mgnify:CR=1 FL=1
MLALDRTSLIKSSGSGTESTTMGAAPGVRAQTFVPPLVLIAPPQARKPPASSQISARPRRLNAWGCC